MQKGVMLGLLAGLLLEAGCTTIVGKSEWPVIVNSTPVGARFTVRNTSGAVVVQGTTPMVITLPASAGFATSAKYEIIFDKDGYDPTCSLFAAQVHPAYMFNVLVACGLGYLIDAGTGTMWKFEEPLSDELLPAGMEAAMRKVIQSYRVGETSWQQCQSDIKSAGFQATLTGLTSTTPSGKTTYVERSTNATMWATVSPQGTIETGTWSRDPWFSVKQDLLASVSREVSRIEMKPDPVFMAELNKDALFLIGTNACVHMRDVRRFTSTMPGGWNPSDVFEITLGRERHPLCRLRFERRSTEKAILTSVDFDVKFPAFQNLHRRDWSSLSNW